MYGYYIKIPNEVLKMTDLTSNDKLLLGLLLTLGYKNDYITAKNDFLAETLGLSIHMIKRSLNTLKKNDYIEIENPNRYRIITLLPLPTKKVVHTDKLDPNIDKLLQAFYDKIWYNYYMN